MMFETLTTGTENDDRHSGKRLVRADLRRHHVLDTARSLFIDNGFHATGVAQIARGAGINVSQLYRDFGSKEGIVEVICRKDMSGWLDEAALTSALNAGDEARVRGWLLRFDHVKASSEQARMMIEIMAEAGRNPRIAELYRDIQARLARSIGQALEAISPGRSHDAMVQLLLAYGLALMNQRLLDPAGARQALSEFVQQAIDRAIGAAHGHAP